MNEIKVYVVGSDYHYADFIYNHIITNNLEEANIVLFTGGEDVSPEMYGEVAIPETYCNPIRDDYELSIFNEVNSETQICVGICRGAQFLTVANGGKLIQHVDKHAIRGTHAIHIEDDSTINITSTHHQMMYPFELDNDDYIVNAHAHLKPTTIKTQTCNRDWIINCYEPEIVTYRCDDKPKCIAIQGHPEIMSSDSDAVKYCNSLIQNVLSKNNIEFINMYKRAGYDSTYFSCHYPNREFKDLEFKMRWCFGDCIKEQLYYCKNHDEILIEYKIQIRHSEPNDRTHYCFFSKDDIVKYIELLKDVFEFDYSLEDGEDCYWLSLSVENTSIYHKLILTYIKYLYQYPLNYILYDSLKLIELQKDNEYMTICYAIAIVSCTLRGYYRTSEYEPMVYNYNECPCIIDKNSIESSIKVYLSDIDNDGLPSINYMFNNYLTMSADILHYNAKFDFTTYDIFKRFLNNRMKCYIKNVSIINK